MTEAEYKSLVAQGRVWLSGVRLHDEARRVLGKEGAEKVYREGGERGVRIALGHRTTSAVGSRCTFDRDRHEAGLPPWFHPWWQDSQG